MRRWFLAIVVALVGVAAALIVARLTHWSAPLQALVHGKRTVQQRLDQYGPAARHRLRAYFDKAGIDYPPQAVQLVAMKDSRQMHLFVADRDQSHFLRTYPILAASGSPGPKLRRGDRQVPEGVYRIESLNPNSRFHLSLRLSYPNEFDRAMADRDGRTDLGGDIMIHGKAASVGCLAMGDPAAEELFVLAADCGIENLTVIIAPLDLRVSPRPTGDSMPEWTDELYDRLRIELLRLPATIRNR